MKISDIYKEGDSVGSLVESICCRPKMYTIGGTLEEVCAFIDAFYSGIVSHNFSEGAVNEIIKIEKLRHFLSKEITGEIGGWREIFIYLRKNYSSEEEAFMKVVELCVFHRHKDDDS